MQPASPAVRTVSGKAGEIAAAFGQAAGVITRTKDAAIVPGG